MSNIYQGHFDYAVEKFEGLEAKVFIADNDTQISTDDFLSPKDSKTIFMNYYTEDLNGNKIVLNEKNFIMVSKAPQYQGETYMFQYVWANPEDRDDKRIALVSNLGDDAIIGVEVPEVLKNKAVDIIQTLWDQ